MVFIKKIWEQIKVLLFRWTADGLRKSADKLDTLTHEKKVSKVIKNSSRNKNKKGE